VLALIFWDQIGILHIDRLPKVQTINAEYYSSLLVQFKDILKEKRSGNFNKIVLFLHDNPLASQKKLAIVGFQCLDHSTYSPDMTPSDHLFPGLKKIQKSPFSSDAETSLEGQYSDFFFFRSLQI
jgi:hypothetical protein